MNKFSSRWLDKTKSDNLGANGRFGRNKGSSESLKPALQKAENSIKNQLAKLDMLLKKLKDKDKKMFNRVCLRIQKHDNKHASVFANELVEIRKMMKMVSQARYALEAIALRIETVRDFGDVVVSLAPAVAAVKNVQLGVSGVIPAAEDRFSEITGLLSDVLLDAGHLNESKLDFKLANEDAEKIIAEASVQAEMNLKKKIPEIPSEIPRSISNVLEEAFT
jgi:division protein CdvB (Snf7/Vps24/ESCRT-III family)